MNENKDYITKVEECGSINVSVEVISTIALAAIMEVDGVAGLAGNISADLSGKISRKNLAKGVKVTVVDGGVKINCAVMVKYGSVIADVARNVQKSVTAAVENMTGITVASVNVHVGGISFAKVEK